jgi:hypothetical protein
MGYSSQKGAPKGLVTGDDIERGAIGLIHLDPGLFVEIQKIALHAHTGTGSRKVNLRDLEGSFGTNGFYMYSMDGTKKFHIQIDNAGTFVITAV